VAVFLQTISGFQLLITRLNSMASDKRILENPAETLPAKAMFTVIFIPKMAKYTRTYGKSITASGQAFLPPSHPTKILWKPSSCRYWCQRDWVLYKLAYLREGLFPWIWWASVMGRWASSPRVMISLPWSCFRPWSARGPPHHAIRWEPASQS